MLDNIKSGQFLVNIGVKASEITDIISKQLKCDYIGLDNEYWHIVEYKRTKEDLQKAIPQILRYYDNLYYSKYNSDDTEQNTYKQYDIKPAWNGKELTKDQLNKCEAKTYHNAYGKHEVKLYIFFDGNDIKGFNRYHSIYRDYIANKKCPNIEFWFTGDEDKPQRL